MTVLQSAICALTTIIGSLVAGFLAKRVYRIPDDLGPRITSGAVRYVQPFAVLLVLWGLHIPDPRAFLLPVIGGVMASLSALAGWGASRILRLPPRESGALVGQAMLSNVGLTHGAFVCFVVMGERGAALGSLYVSFFLIYFFTVGVAVGRYFGRDTRETSGSFLRDTLAQPVSRNPLLGVVTGLAMNLLDVPRPVFLAPVAELAVPISVAILLFGIGMTMRISTLRQYMRQCLALSVVKFVVSPILGLLVAFVFGLFATADRSLLQVAFIQSFTPAAIYALVLTSLFDLDQDLANACWLFTNALGIALIPLVIFLAGIL